MNSEDLYKGMIRALISRPRRHRLTTTQKSSTVATSLKDQKILPQPGFERSQQLRGDQSGAVAIGDCWLWLIVAENLFSKTTIRRRQIFAVANNSHTQISRPRRHRLTTTQKSSTVATSLKDQNILPQQGFERSQQLRGDRSEAVAIGDCWLWLIVAENLFSKTIIRRRQIFAIANNSHTQISRPRRHRLTNPLSTTKKNKTTKSSLV